MEVISENMVQGLYGSMIKSAKAIGYCKYHRCYLTIATLKNHECLRKQCNAIQKNKCNEYWQQREQKKLTKKINKINGV